MSDNTPPTPLAYFIADVHLDNFAQHGGAMHAGLNDRARATLRALRHAVRMAHRHPLFIAGDLFHTSRPSPALITAVQQALTNSAAVVLVGNHDQESSADFHNALSPLGPVCHVAEGVHVSSLAHPGYRDKIALSVGFQAGPVTDWLPRALADMTQRCHVIDVLCIHAGISDGATPYYLDNTVGAINVDDLVAIVKPYGIKAVFAGDWHRHQVWNIDGVRVCQIGSLAPSRFPPNYEHGHIGPMVELMSDFSIRVHDIPGPRFYKHRWRGPDFGITNFTGDPAFVRIECRTDQVVAVREWLVSTEVEAKLADCKAPTFEISIDRGVEQAKARAASFEARQASSLDEALANYVQRMPIGDGVDRQQVLAHVRRLMA